MPERRQYFLFAIFVCSAIEQSSRSLLSYLVNFAAETPSSSSAQPPHGDGSTYLYVNVDLGFDRVFYSVLSSYAFAIPFFVCSILAGLLSDHVRGSLGRSVWSGLGVHEEGTGWFKVLLLISPLLSGAAVASQGMCQSSAALLVTRALNGIGQAFFAPVAYTLLSEWYPVGNRAAVNGMVSSAVYVGSGIASLSIMLNIEYGWRVTSYIVGGAGVASTVLLAPVDRPDDCQPMEIKSVPSIFERGMLRRILYNRTLMLLYLGGMFRFFAGFSILVFLPPYVVEMYPAHQLSYSTWHAVIVSIFGSVSSIGGGVLADKLHKSHGAPSQLWVAAGGSLLGAVCTWQFIGTRDFVSFLLWLLAAYLLAESWFGPVISTVQMVAPPSLSGTAVGILPSLSITGYLAPVFIGWQVHSIGCTEACSTGKMLMYVVCGSYVGAAICFMFASCLVDGDVADGTDEPRLERMEREGSLTVQQMDERADEATTLLGGRPKGEIPQPRPPQLGSPTVEHAKQRAALRVAKGQA